MSEPDNQKPDQMTANDCRCGHGAKSEAQRELAISALLTRPSIKAAAETAGICESTLTRWLREDQFKRDYRRARQEIVSQSTARLQARISEAVDVLFAIAGDTEAAPSARVSAARTIIETAHKAVEVEDLLERVERLEANIDRENKNYADNQD